MWNGPYGDWGSKKYLVANLDQSIKRMELDYVDIFYHLRPDPNTPVEETMSALDLIVRKGKVLYVGLSNYKSEEAKQAIGILKKLGTPCLIHQPKYSMFERWVEDGLLSVLGTEGVGCIPFSPLAQGLLTDKYLHGIPAHSRVSKAHGFLKESHIMPDKLNKISQLNTIAEAIGQTLAQTALAWILKDKELHLYLLVPASPSSSRIH